MLTFHYAMRALQGTLLARDHVELFELWARFAAAFPGLVALCVMPDHVHLLLAVEVDPEAIRAVMRGYARWLNARRGCVGAVWRPLDPPVVRIGAAKRRTDVRYVHLNPCRARLVSDPLAWPASTHLDATGLALWPVRAVEPDPDEFHRYVSSDPSVAVTGSLLPALDAAPTAEQVLAAVSALARATGDDLVRRSPARSLFVRAARVLTSASNAEIAELAQVCVRTVEAAPRISDPRVARIARVAGDPRFPLANEEPVAAWERYRRWRASVGRDRSGVEFREPGPERGRAAGSGAAGANRAWSTGR